jgi:ATP-dependent DNA helicase RecG
MPSDDDLLALLARGESERAEFKVSYVADSAREVVCAFANDLNATGEPGVLFIGIDDEGRASGRPIIDDALLSMLAQIRTGGDIQPLPSIAVRSLKTAEGSCAVVIVEPTDDPPMRYRGRIWVRVGPTTLVASPQDERRLVERRRIANPPYDHLAAADATSAALDISYFEQRYLRAAYAPDLLERNGRTREEQLEALRFITARGAPTVGGVLTLSRTARRFLPGAYVQFVRYAGTDLVSAVVDHKELGGMLEEIASDAMDLLRLHVPIALERSEEGGPDRRPVLYPLIALQELVVNAMMHRTYESNTPIRISYFADRIEIISPGGPFGDVTQANFGQPNVTAYRNPIVAEALKTLGLAQRFGFGIAAARAALRNNGNPPLRIDPQPTIVTVTLFAR